MGSARLTAKQDSPFVALLMRRDYAVCALLAIAVTLGGGGVGAGFLNLVVQLLGLAILAVHSRAILEFATKAPRGLVILALATLALPLLQLIPLPAQVWSALPGRDLVSQSLSLIGERDAWMPFSVDPNRTFLGFIALLPAFAVLALGWNLDRAQTERVQRLIIGLALFSVALGAVQLASANRVGNLYPGGHPLQVYGTFANHNSTGLFLVIAIVLLAGLRNDFKRTAAMPGLRIVLFNLLAIAVVLTQSRSSTALLLVPAVLLIFRLRHSQGSDARRGKGAALTVVLPLALFFAGTGYVLLTNDKVRQTVERFESLDDPRPLIWQDSLASAGRFWPLGSGAGTFDEVFQVDESLEHIGPARAGRAHNDYLELAVESGVVGLLLLLGWMIWLAGAVRSAASRSDSASRYAAAAGIGCIAAQSVLDYPLRNEALLCIAAVLIVLLIRNSSPRQA